MSPCKSESERYLNLGRYSHIPYESPLLIDVNRKSYCGHPHIQPAFSGKCLQSLLSMSLCTTKIIQSGSASGHNIPSRRNSRTIVEHFPGFLLPSVFQVPTHVRPSPLPTSCPMLIWLQHYVVENIWDLFDPTLPPRVAP
jgi:hypothetical protein